MFSNPIESGISTLGAPVLTDVFLVVMFISFILSAYWKKTDKHTAFTQYTPTLLTSLGILGTFMGIVAGLLEFNTTDIDKSIGPLLEGLKTAFITSLTGMFLSITYKMLASSGLITPKADSNNIDPEEITGADLFRVMSEQNETMIQLKRQFCEGNDKSVSDLYDLVEKQTVYFEKIQSAIGGDNESSLVGQFKLMRSDMNDNQRRSEKHMESSVETLITIENALTEQKNHFSSFEKNLWHKLEEFAEMMSKSATEQVIEALKTVIQDFNNNLTEQFGENFKQLNSAVLELVTWQENYKQQLAEMKAQYDQGVQAITQTETSVAHIGEKAQSIPVAMDNLTKVMTVNQHQIDELSRHLEAFEQIRDKAVEAVPEIREQVDMAIASARTANEEMAKGVQESTEQLKTVVAESAENYRDAVDNTRTTLSDVATETANSSIAIKEQFSSALSDINTNMRDLVEELQSGGKELNRNYIAAGEQLTSDIRNSSGDLTKAYKELSAAYIADTESMSKKFHQGLEEMQGTLANTIQEQAQAHRQQADQVFDGLEKSIREALSSTGESVEKQINMIDQTMGQEVEKVMNAMGSALTSISGQFTSDYRELVREMQAVTRERA